MTVKWTITSMAAGLILTCLAGQAAQAAPRVDSFSRVTAAHPATATSATHIDPAKLSDPVKWFETMDELVSRRKPTSADRVILSRPFNQEAERVQEWINTAGKVSKNYRELAKLLKQLPVSPGLPGVADYRDLTADWYSDAAAIYEDLIRPRKAARTMEELEEQIQQIKDRAQSLSQANANLKAMDLSLRKTYKVHLARHEDALQQYVRGK